MPMLFTLGQHRAHALHLARHKCGTEQASALQLARRCNVQPCKSIPRLECGKVMFPGHGLSKVSRSRATGVIDDQIGPVDCPTSARSGGTDRSISGPVTEEVGVNDCLSRENQGRYQGVGGQDPRR